LTAAVDAGEMPGYATEAEAFEQRARSLAGSHGAIERPRRGVADFLDAPILASSLEQAQRRLASGPSADAALRKPAEWFLDNYYLIRRVARQVAEELPRGFVQRLPVLASGPARGLPRLYDLARAVVVDQPIEVDAAVLQRFIHAYQQIATLTIAELWALPAMLRFAVLGGLVDCLRKLHLVDEGPGTGTPEPALHPATGIERSIRLLRLLADVDWSGFFEENCRVEAILQRDPAHVYDRMDFATCDAYRKAVEELAWASGVTEGEVAERAVALALGGTPDERRGHVGFYLVGEGRGLLERAVRYRPAGIERLRRALRRWPTPAYLVPVAVATAAQLGIVGGYASHASGHALSIAAAVALTLVPASVVAIALVQRIFAVLLPPRVLPKLDFSKGLPDDARALVVMPTLLGQAVDVEEMLRQIERHYIANPDAQLQFALLTDDVDSKTAPGSHALLEAAARGIGVLNAKHGTDGAGPFHLLYREPRWNPSERRFMGWERKRGKLEELNRLLRGDQSTSYTRHVGNPKGLDRIRFVITLDSDTELPMGSARRLVGLLAHPLNRAVFDDTSGSVVSGYTIVQPRIETSPATLRRTLFSKIYAGDVGFDIYTHAVSDTYQDLFGTGIYVGKGIYEVDAFVRSLEGRVPENAIASHDLFEGVHARTALASDIVLFEDYPFQYAAYSRRMHRWLRGDWQLLPWLFPWVPSARGAALPNPLALIDRWKIVDNLRRGLAKPMLLLLLIAGWIALPGDPRVWTLGATAASLGPIVPAVAAGRRRRGANLARGALELAFVAHEASVVADAVARVLVRMLVTHKHLLQWTSAANTARGLGSRSPRALWWREMFGSPLWAVAATTLLAGFRPSALLVASPFLLAWLAAPELARWLSQPVSAGDPLVGVEDLRWLRLLARRTWLFFETFVGPSDQWLPVDNYQEPPHEQTAHRTSPTNIGMMLLSTLAAYDLGYLGPAELHLRLRSSLDSMVRLTHYQGHLLNWVDTKNLQPLLPRYVSTVDSGNLAGCLMALEQGCHGVAAALVLRPAAWDGLTDCLDLLDGVLESCAKGAAASSRALVARMRQSVKRARLGPSEAHTTLRALCEETAVELDRELHALLHTGALRHEADALHAMRTWVDRLHHQLREMRREIEELLPWLAWKDEPAAEGLDLPSALRLDEIPAAARALREALETRQRAQHAAASADLGALMRRMIEGCSRADASARALIDGLLDVATRAAAEVRGMDFRLLFDADRKLFSIGFNVTLDRIDPHHYDILASEARLASYIAVVRREVPEAHWYALGRPMTRVAGAPALLSWGGTMFEYLMPTLLMRSQRGTLLAESCDCAVEAQIAYAQRLGGLWGVSESAYDRLDAHQTYQYRSFGVPGLGFKRGLENDRVVAPYASALALSIRPRAVLDNLSKLESMAMIGAYGFFEAVDLHPDRASPGRPVSVVRSYMAHHQGMVLVALDNFLSRQVMVDRFHANPSIEAGEMLLNERAPAGSPSEWPLAEPLETAKPSAAATPPSPPTPWSPRADGRPQAFVLSNGKLTSLVTHSGAGGLRWQGLTLTSYAPDPTRDGDGVWIYLQDEASGRVWPATSDEGRTTFAMHKAEFHRREQGISVHVAVAVAPVDDVEVRQITLHNETDRPRRLTVATAAEPVLLEQGQAARHPAFARMFVESEFVAELDALLFARRLRSAKEEPAVLVHGLVCEDAAVTFSGYETDRGAFFGRCAVAAGAPRSLSNQSRGRRGQTGAVLDPVMSLMAAVELNAKGTATLAFVTAVGRCRADGLDLARRYRSMHAVRWAFRDAEQQSGRRLQRARLGPETLPAVQRLLSALLFGDPSLRAPPDVIAAGRPCKSRLWGRGISGDVPILALRVHDAQAPLLGEVIAAHRYLRSCGFRVDVLLFDELASGYVTDDAGTLRRALTEYGAADWIDRRGGIFVIAADQISDDERHHLEASARVVLDGRGNSLAASLDKTADVRPHLPRFEPTLADDGVAGSMPRPDLLFDNGTGGFTEDGSEYVVTVGPETTPAPWCNVLANPHFGCLVSESSLGCTWSLNSGENRLTPWRNDPVFDTPSEALYLRDEETAAVWSPTPLPAGRDAETIVRHGAGYTTYARASHGLEQTLTIFVPPDEPIKIARLSLKNTQVRHRRITATYYAEWVLGTLREEQQPYVTSDFERGVECLLATSDWNAEFAGRVAFLASTDRVHGFTADRTEFLGRGGDYRRPEALDRWGLSGRAGAGLDPCAALQVHLELAPGERIETAFLLGQTSDRASAVELVRRLGDRSAIDAAWNALGAFWEGLLGSVRVRTPEPAMNVMLNRWLLYQSVTARLFGRTGFYQSSGAFGFRDQLQDVMALFHAAPDKARAHILEAAAHQFEEGDVLHWWHPPSGRGVRTRCSDDLVWLPFVTAEYVLATGDTGILSESLPFLAGDPLRRDEQDHYAQFARASRSASLLEHCRRALERAATQGRHGLPRMGDGDWNDGMNRVGSAGQGESVWLGWFLYATMNRFASLCDRVDERAEAAAWRNRSESLRLRVESSAWDGSWYLRAFHDDGSLIGSASSRECRIDSIAQSWAVLSNGADPARARAALQAADDQLVRQPDKLVLLLWPPFDSTLHDPGYIRAYPPGVRENGGQYTHAATWLGWAWVALREGDRAARIFRLINPILATSTSEQSNGYRVEPYVLAGDVYSCAPSIGRGGWTWYTGAAAWAWRLGVEGILGLRKQDGHLAIDPCIPSEWKGFEAWLRVGAAQIHVVVDNPDAARGGIAAMTVDGVLLEGSRVRIDPGARGVIEVRVRLGSPDRRPSLVGAAGASGRPVVTRKDAGPC
jgi:cyclic beta-1,2-glucan glucanotransferase